MIEIIITIIVLVIIGWYPFFNYMTRNTSHRIIKRGEGYVIQSKTFYKWKDITFDDSQPIIFKNKEDAAEVLILAKSKAGM